MYCKYRAMYCVWVWSLMATFHNCKVWYIIMTSSYACTSATNVESCIYTSPLQAWCVATQLGLDNYFSIILRVIGSENKAENNTLINIASLSYYNKYMTVHFSPWLWCNWNTRLSCSLADCVTALCCTDVWEMVCIWGQCIYLHPFRQVVVNKKVVLLVYNTEWSSQVAYSTMTHIYENKWE